MDEWVDFHMLQRHFHILLNHADFYMGLSKFSYVASYVLRHNNEPSDSTAVNLFHIEMSIKSSHQLLFLDCWAFWSIYKNSKRAGRDVWVDGVWSDWGGVVLVPPTHKHTHTINMFSCRQTFFVLVYVYGQMYRWRNAIFAYHIYLIFFLLF